jgi:hypothetical protein
MQKQLIFIAGTMGVGKTATAQALKKLLPASVLLDGDWCWDMNPFVVNEQTKAMVQDNIVHLLDNFLSCPQFDYVIFCWVMHQREIVQALLDALKADDYVFHFFALTCSPQTLVGRLEADVLAGKRSGDVIDRSLPRLALYPALGASLLDTTALSPQQAAKAIAGRVAPR